ncbi:MAG: hypothetical protein F4X25_04430 [Chloroflexi bacterium]|nr:hypothetical protein [Chloroflexota bacterium]
MTQQPPPPGQPDLPPVQPPERQYALQLHPEGMGTLLGAIAWVLGALAIMRDRGHAEGDEELHELQESLEPRLETLLNDLAMARGAVEGGGETDLGERVEAAYTRVREAFERWIQLTAVDTASVAIGQRLAEIADEAEAGAGDDVGDGPDEA